MATTGPMGAAAAGEVGVMGYCFSGVCVGLTCSGCGDRFSGVYFWEDSRTYCTDCYHGVQQGAEIHAQAMRWLRLSRHDNGADRHWIIGRGPDGTEYSLWMDRGEYWIEGANPLGLSFIDRRTARALLVAAEAYAAGGEE